MIDFAVIGSGISGATISNKLNKKYYIKVFEKAKGVGGRSSFKRFEGKIGFDHGLQYLSPRSKEFKAFTNKLIKKRGMVIYDNDIYYSKILKKICKNKNLKSLTIGKKILI